MTYYFSCRQSGTTCSGVSVSCLLCAGSECSRTPSESHSFFFISQRSIPSSPHIHSSCYCKHILGARGMCTFTSTWACVRVCLYESVCVCVCVCVRVGREEVYSRVIELLYEEEVGVFWLHHSHAGSVVWWGGGGGRCQPQDWVETTSPSSSSSPTQPPPRTCSV